MINCPKCNASLQGDVLDTWRLTVCPACGVVMQAAVFPAMFREPQPLTSGDTLVLEGEASCFYHPKKKAVVPCAACGRFICALCDVELNRQHLCPSCLEKGKRKRKFKNLENHRTLYDSIALSLAIVPMLFIFPTIITAPMVIFIVIRYWKAPTSILPRTKIRFILAFMIAGLQITGWTFSIFL